VSSQTPSPTLDAQSADDLAGPLGAFWADEEVTYKNSPFLPLKQLSSRKKGAEFERIFEHHARAAGYVVTRADSSNYDRRADSHRVEVKGSFQWAGTGQFRWQQIRVDQEYDYVVFLAVYPDRVEFYACTHETAKRELQKQNAAGDWVHNQHGGKSTDSGTYFIDGRPADFPWLQPLSAVLPAPSSTVALS